MFRRLKSGHRWYHIVSASVLDLLMAKRPLAAPAHRSWILGTVLPRQAACQFSRMFLSTFGEVWATDKLPTSCVLDRRTALARHFVVSQTSDMRGSYQLSLKTAMTAREQLVRSLKCECDCGVWILWEGSCVAEVEIKQDPT